MSNYDERLVDDLIYELEELIAPLDCDDCKVSDMDNNEAYSICEDCMVIRPTTLNYSPK